MRGQGCAVGPAGAARFLTPPPVSAAIVVAALAPVLREPSIRAEQVTQLAAGETALVLGADGEWRRVRTSFDRYEGWIHQGYLREVHHEDADAWRRSATGWSLGAMIGTDQGRVRLPLRARVTLAPGRVGLANGAHGLLLEGQVVEGAALAAAAEAVGPEDWALAHFAGAPYEWGGITPWGVDCSGLVQTTYAARGIALPRDAREQADHGDPVASDAARPGDLLYFSEPGDGITHVAWLASGDTIVHATLACGGVVRESWAEGSRAAVLRPQLVAVRRIAPPRLPNGPTPVVAALRSTPA